MNGTMVEKEIEAQVKQLKKDLGQINTLIERKNIKKKYKDGLERRYKMKQRGLPVTREEIKERIKAKNNKIKRYQSRINQYQQNDKSYCLLKVSGISAKHLGRKKTTPERY